MPLNVLEVAPLVESVAIALLPSTDGAIYRSSCCFEVTKSRDALVSLVYEMRTRRKIRGEALAYESCLDQA